MTREEAVRHACATVGIAFHSIGDYTRASDCFCDKHDRFVSSFANNGLVLEYVREAVIRRLISDGYAITEETQ